MTDEKTYPRKFGDPLRNPSRKLAFAGYSAITGNKNLSPYTGEDHPYYQAPISGETQQQGMRRRELNPVQWTEHELGPGSSWVNTDTNKPESTLGPDYITALDEIIEAKMLDHHDEHSDSEQHLTEFLAVHEQWRADYWQQLQKAETFLTQYRRSQDMRPFNWALEHRASVLAILGLDAGKPRSPRTIEKRQKIALWHFVAKQKKGDTVEAATKSPGDLPMLQRLIKTKPEYSGANHPLEFNQVKRTLKPVKASAAAIAALKQFDTTGKIILPDPPAPSGIHLKSCTWDPGNKSSIPCNCDIDLDMQSTSPIIPDKNRFKTLSDPLRDESLFGYCDDIVERQKIYLAVEDNPNATTQEKAAAFETFMKEI